MIQIKYEISQYLVSNFHAMKTPIVPLWNNRTNNVPLLFVENTSYYPFGTIQLISVLNRQDRFLNHSKNQSNKMETEPKKYEVNCRRKTFLLLLFKKVKLVATERCSNIGAPKKYL